MAENSIRMHVNSNLPRHEIEDLEKSVEVETNEDLTVNVEVNLDTLTDNKNRQEMVEGGVEAAHTAVKNEFERISRGQ